MAASRNSVIVALGSNLGESRTAVLRAMERLSTISVAPLARSSLWETAPLDCPPGSPPFINAIIALTPREGETPESLLRKLQLLEQEFGRQPKKIINEPRPLDLDLIAFADQVRRSESLILPHPRAHERRFVLQPLSEIAPSLVLPGQRQTVCELLEKLPPDPAMRRVA